LGRRIPNARVHELLTGGDDFGIAYRRLENLDRDAVYARVDKDRIGTFAEFAAVRDGAIALKPINVTFEEAAALPLVALTAWQALVEIGKARRQPAFARSWGLNPMIVFAISLLSRKTLAAARKHKARYEYLFVHADGEQLKEIARLVESGAITPLVDKLFRLDEVRDALAYAESGRATGKVVIKVV
jgi:NADPH:quinone reductase-like Zn-dependent oxidoreductase